MSHRPATHLGKLRNVYRHRRLLTAAAFSLESLECRRLLTAITFTVSNTNDSGGGSLRQAILDSNSNSGHDTIAFAIGTGVQEIQPLSALPTVTDAVTIDGTTQPGYAGTPLVWIDGSKLPNASIDGLLITAGSSTVTALSITDFKHGAGIHLTTNGSNLINLNYLGVQPTGSDPPLQFFNINGVVADSDSNHIQQNLLSGNDSAGALINGSHTLLDGNFIGTDSTGSSAVSNGLDGISIRNGATDTTIGGATAAARNLISGSGRNGIDLRGAGTALIEGNYIGTDIAGTLVLGNSGNGVYVNAPTVTPNVAIGGTNSNQRNIISGNSGDGVRIDGASGIVVQGNFIGTDLTGTLAVDNGGSGVTIVGNSSNNTIGGSVAGSRNILSGNDADGATVSASLASTGNVIQGNYIGTDVTGTLAVANSGNGVTLESVASVTGNLISGNSGDGVDTADSASVTSNFIGLKADHLNALGNGLRGVAIFGSNNSVTSNTVANNGDAGIAVMSGTGNTIRSNSIYANTTIGVDLNDDGVTLNDSGGHTNVPNNYQNFPVITGATSSAGTISIDGSLSADASKTYTLDFYANPAADPSGYGQGKNYLGSTTVMTNGSGAATFSAVSFSLPTGQTVVTATATDPDGNTSEFALDAGIIPAVGQPQSISQTLNFPLDPSNTSLPHTNWDNTQSILPFDPSLGTLTSIDIVDMGMITVNIGVENDSNMADTFNMSVSGNISLSGPSLETTMGPVSINSGPYLLGAFDGNDDFMGDSGHTFGPMSNTASINVTLTSADDMAPYMGTESVSFRDVATASASGAGGGNFTAFADSTATGQVTVIYHYMPLQSPPHAAIPAFIQLSPDARISTSAMASGGELMSIDAGTVTFTGDASSLAPNFDLMVASGAHAVFNAPQHLHNLSLSGNATASLGQGGNNTLVTDNLFIDSTHGASLDIGNNSVVLNYTGASPQNDIRAYLLTGRGAGAGQPATWNGAGIKSTYANQNGNGFNLAIGYADNTDLASVRSSGSYTSFGGQTVSSNAVLLRLTRGGDATLDGVVDAQDVTVLGSHLNKLNSGEWCFGDFDYSALCDATDVTTLGSNFGKTTPAFSPATRVLTPTIVTSTSTSTSSSSSSSASSPSSSTTTYTAAPKTSVSTSINTTSSTSSKPAPAPKAVAAASSADVAEKSLKKKPGHPFNLLSYITATD